MYKREPEVQHREEEQEKDRHDEGELDQSLPELSRCPPERRGTLDAPDHRIGSIRIAFDDRHGHAGAAPQRRPVAGSSENALPRGVTKRYP